MFKKALIVFTAIFATIAVSMFSFTSHADPKRSVPLNQVGPDVVTWYTGGGSGLDMENYGSGDGILSFAFGTTSCNWGDTEATWGSNGNDSYPVIAQNCYRLANGRFEQIGTSWLKHSFCAVSEPGCGSCQSTPCSTLGIGCADTYWAGLNADTTAPRSEINAFTGQYSYPFGISPTGESWRRGRLLLAEDDISSSNNPDALYFIEGQYICSDEAAWSSQWNNCSWRQVQFNNMTNPGAINQTQVADPAIFAWKEHDDEVDLQMVQIIHEGQLHVGARAYDNGDGTWDYEYAVHNMNSHRSVGRFTVSVGGSTVITNVGFNDADYHSGEVIDTTDWTWEQDGEDLVWTTDSYDDNEWANAIRWGSLYNFRFTANVGPKTGDIVLGLFRPGTPDSVIVETVVPLGTPASVIFSYPNGRPEMIDPNGGTTVDITIAPGSADPVSDSATLHWSVVDGANGTSPMNDLGNDNYQAVFPAFDCEAIVNWYISVNNTDGNNVTSPSNAPKSTWSGIALTGYQMSFEDDFQTDQGWAVDSGADTGNWERVVPSNGGARCDAPTDADGSGMCYVTGDGTDEDVDGGTTILTSPPMDASSSPTLSYYRWYNNGSTCGGFATDDVLNVEFSNDGQTWMNLETIGPGGSEVSGNWFLKEFDLTTVPGFVPSDQFRVRFIVGDLGDGSIVEAGVDGILLSGGYCDEVGCSSDVTGDGVVNVGDLLTLIAAWGPCGGCDEDLDGSGTVDVADLLMVIGDWGPYE